VKGAYPLVGIRIPATRPPGVRLLTDEIAKSECDVVRCAPLRMSGAGNASDYAPSKCGLFSKFWTVFAPGGREFFEEIVQTLESVGCKYRLPVQVVSAVVPLDDVAAGIGMSGGYP